MYDFSLDDVRQHMKEHDLIFYVLNRAIIERRKSDSNTGEDDAICLVEMLHEEFFELSNILCYIETLNKK